MVSVDGFVGVEASCVLRRVAEVLSWKWGKSYGQVMDWVRSGVTIAGSNPSYWTVFERIESAMEEWERL